MGEVNGNPVQDGELSYTLPHPYGVIATIITWNSPLMWIAMKAAALATGNTVVIKPSSLTPFTGQLCMDLVEDVLLGVINVLPAAVTSRGSARGPLLVKKISFTGGPATATKILEVCADTAKPSVMELRGKSADIVFEDTGAHAFNTFCRSARSSAPDSQGAKPALALRR